MIIYICYTVVFNLGDAEAQTQDLAYTWPRSHIPSLMVCEGCTETQPCGSAHICTACFIKRLLPHEPIRHKIICLSAKAADRLLDQLLLWEGAFELTP